MIFKLFRSPSVESLLPSRESLLRWSQTRACTRTRAWMHRRVIFALFLTLCPLTKACSLTSPLSALRALLAFNTRPKSKSITVYLKMRKCVIFIYKKWKNQPTLLKNSLGSSSQLLRKLIDSAYIKGVPHKFKENVLTKAMQASHFLSNFERTIFSLCTIHKYEKKTTINQLP